MTDSLKISGALLEVFRSKGIGPQVADNLDCTAGLVTYLEGARQSIYFAIFSLTSEPIAQALIHAKERGLDVYGIADSRQWANKQARNAELTDAGIYVIRAWHQHACMHLKVAVIDMHIVALGSFNWTANAEEHNDEVLLVSDSQELAEVCKEQIDQARALNA